MAKKLFKNEWVIVLCLSVVFNAGFGAVLVFDDFEDDSSYGQPSNPPWNSTAMAAGYVNRVDPDAGAYFGSYDNMYLRMRQLSGNPAPITMRRGIRSLKTGYAAVIVSFDFFDMSNTNPGTTRCSFLVGGPNGAWWERFDFRGGIIRNFLGEWLHITPYAMGAMHSVKIVVNNSSSALQYDGGTQSVASGTYDLWLDNVKIQDDKAHAIAIPVGLELQDFEFEIPGFSDGGSREFYFDNFKIESIAGGEASPPNCAAAIQFGYSNYYDITGPDATPDCKVDIHDFAEFAKNWLYCFDPEIPGCDKPWQ